MKHLAQIVLLCALSVPGVYLADLLYAAETPPKPSPSPEVKQAAGVSDLPLQIVTAGARKGTSLPCCTRAMAAGRD